MASHLQKFSSQAPAEVLDGVREIARKEGRLLRVVVEEAMREYIQSKAENGGRTEQVGVRPEVMAHYRASVERNRLLYELLAQ